MDLLVCSGFMEPPPPSKGNLACAMKAGRIQFTGVEGSLLLTEHHSWCHHTAHIQLCSRSPRKGDPQLVASVALLSVLGAACA